jgi:hypothetical protein
LPFSAAEAFIDGELRAKAVVFAPYKHKQPGEPQESPRGGEGTFILRTLISIPGSLRLAAHMASTCVLLIDGGGSARKTKLLFTIMMTSGSEDVEMARHLLSVLYRPHHYYLIHCDRLSPGMPVISYLMSLII